MRKLLLLLFFVPALCFGQEKEFNFSKMDSINLKTEEIYNKTKEFIADTWNSAKTVIQNDSKELIQLKGLIVKEYGVGMGLSCEYTYSYTVKFRIKDFKYKIEIYDIACKEAYQVGLGTRNEVPLIQPFYEEPKASTQSWGKGLSKKKATIMMLDLEKAFTEMISNYEKKLKITDDF